MIYKNPQLWPRITAYTPSLYSRGTWPIHHHYTPSLYTIIIHHHYTPSLYSRGTWLIHHHYTVEVHGLYTIIIHHHYTPSLYTIIIHIIIQSRYMAYTPSLYSRCTWLVKTHFLGPLSSIGTEYTSETRFRMPKLGHADPPNDTMVFLLYTDYY